MITNSEAVFLMIAWFAFGRQLGHVGAKYARAKKESKIIMLVFCIIAVASSLYILK